MIVYVLKLIQIHHTLIITIIEQNIRQAQTTSLIIRVILLNVEITVLDLKTIVNDNS